MDSNNFVGPNGDGYDVYVNGQLKGHYTDLDSAQRVFNSYQSAPSSPPAASGPATGPLPSTNVGAIDYAQMQLQSQIAAAQQAYYLMRLQMLEIPQFQAQTDIDRHNLALQALNIYATQTGWIDPQAFAGFQDWANSGANPVGTGGTGSTGSTGTSGMYNTSNGQRTIDQMRQELFQASGGMQEKLDADDATTIADYQRTTGGPVTAVSNTTPSLASNTPATDAASGAVPTIAGAANLASPTSLAGNMSLLGMDASQLPAQDKQPTLQAQQIFGNPAALPQSMIMAGMTPQQTAQAIQGSSGYRQITGAAPATQTFAQTDPWGNGAEPANFQFVQGNQLPLQQTQQWLATGSPYAKLITGLAAFSGQDPSSFWQQYQASLPTSNTNPLSKFI